MREWNEFSIERFESKYMPSMGDGNTMASQAETAVNKLVYKYFNDGDVYDNNYYLDGFGNDISGSANWLYKYIKGADEILLRITDCISYDDYTDILYDLCELVYADGLLEKLNKKAKVGDAYTEDGPFSYTEPEEDDYEEEFWGDEEEEYW